MRRIVPALYLVIFSSIIPSIFILTPYELKDFSQSIVSATTFTSNIFFPIKGDYFSSSSDLKPLIHTWSLSVEEQFYILYPILYYILIKKRLQPGKTILLCLLASLILAQFLSNNLPEYNFYLTLTRSWEFLCGVLLIYIDKNSFHSSLKKRNALSIIGAILILLPIFAYNEKLNSPSIEILPVLLGTSIIILYAKTDTYIGKILSTKLMFYIGTISYSLYLWHQPVFAFSRVFLDYEILNNSLILISQYLVILALSHITYKYIETPFRNPKKIPSYKFYIIFSTSTLLLIFTGLLGHFNNGFPNRYSNEKVKILNYKNYNKDPIYRSGECFLKEGQVFSDFPAFCLPNTKIENTTLVWGDSFAAAISYGIRTRNPAQTAQLSSFTCPPILDYEIPSNSYCHQINENIINTIKERRPDNIILHARWNIHRKAVDSGKLHKTIQRIKSLSPESNLLIIGGAPQWYPSLPELIVKSEKSKKRVHSQFYDEIKKTDDSLEKIATKESITFISLLNHLCLDKKCISLLQDKGGGKPIAWDYGHLTAEGSLFIYDKIFKENSKSTLPRKD